MGEPSANGNHSAQVDDDDAHAQAEAAKIAANDDFKGAYR